MSENAAFRLTFPKISRKGNKGRGLETSKEDYSIISRRWCSLFRGTTLLCRGHYEALGAIFMRIMSIRTPLYLALSHTRTQKAYFPLFL